MSKQSDAPIEANLRRRVADSLVVAALLTMVVGFFSWRSSHRAADDADRMASGYAVIEKLDLTTSDVIEVETNAQTPFSSKKICPENVLLLS